MAIFDYAVDGIDREDARYLGDSCALVVILTVVTLTLQCDFCSNTRYFRTISQ